MPSIINRSSILLQSKLFRGFGDPARLTILQALQNNPLTVTEIVAVSGLSQPNTSNHLRCLRECGLVTAEQQGKFVTYRLSDQRIATLLELGEALLMDTARGVYECTHYTLSQHEPSPDSKTSNDQSVS